MRPGRIGAFFVGLSAAVWVACAGCAQKREYMPEVEPQSLETTAFLHYLATVPVASVEEGCRAMCIETEREEEAGSFDACYQELVDAGIVRSEWGLEADQVLDKGTLAFMATRACGVPPGVNSVLMGSWGLGDRRYALKDAVSVGLMPPGVAWHSVRGGELLAVLAEMEDYVSPPEE